MEDGAEGVMISVNQRSYTSETDDCSNYRNDIGTSLAIVTASPTNQNVYDQSPNNGKGITQDQSSAKT